jgi:long-chain acyl-CoA synthetase
MVLKYDHLDSTIPDMLYDHLLRATAERYADRPAVISDNRTIYYHELVTMVDQVANGLVNRGLKKGDHIGFFTPNCVEFFILLNAASTIGAVVVPLSPAFRERDIIYTLRDCNIVALMVHTDLLPILMNVLAETELPFLKNIISIGHEMVPEGLLDAVPFSVLMRDIEVERAYVEERSAEDLFMIAYSSGTTGLPKGVMLTHRNLVMNSHQFLAVSSLCETDSTLLFMPMAHVTGVFIIGAFVAAGARMVLMDRFEPEKVCALCEEHAISYLIVAPPMVKALANAPDLSQLHSITFLISVAAPLPPQPAHVFMQRTGITLVNGYGMTELTAYASMSPAIPDISIRSVGLPAPGTRIKIVDSETGMQELRLGEDGEVIVQGPQVMLGYWNAPEETARTLRNGWLYTGDIGHLDAQGLLYLTDRKKEMIKYNGYSIAPTELESLLLEHPAVRDAAVIGVPDAQLNEVPTAFIVLREDACIEKQALLTFVNSRVGHYKHVYGIHFVAAIPYSPAGKILRRELKERMSHVQIATQIGTSES